MREIDRMKIRLEPVDGLTLERRTKEEWSLGYLFRVIWSDSPLFRTGSTLTAQDIWDQERYHPVKFYPEFKFQTVTQYHQQRADVDHGYEQAAQSMGLIPNQEEL